MISKVKNVLGHHDELISNPDPRVGTTFTPSDRLEVVVVPRGKVGEEVFLESHDMVKGKHIAYRDPKGELWFGHDHFDGAGKPMNLFRFKIVKGAAAPGRTFRSSRTSCRPRLASSDRAVCIASSVWSIPLPGRPLKHIFSKNDEQFSCGRTRVVCY